ncbi:sororin [Spea bombifrons]|uniref:sororin n=1 Tax=Spea bombifrons TaxID=233779 RepID=UPI00234C007E|nr:sororin [Spea bombifrons]
MSALKKRGSSAGPGRNECITSPSSRRSQRKLSSNNASGMTSPANRRSQNKLSSNNCSGMTFMPSRRSQRNLSSNGSSETSSPSSKISERGLSSDRSSAVTSPKKILFVNKASDSPMPVPVIKKQITAKKIMPRKTLLTHASLAPLPTPKDLSITPAPRRKSSRVSQKCEKENATLDNPQSFPKSKAEQSSSEIEILSPITFNISVSPKLDREHVMSQKVRRSYSRLEMSLNSSSFLYSPTRKNDSSDTSTPNPLPKSGRRSLFGFDKLLSSETQEEEMGIKAKRDSGERGHEVTNKSTVLTSLEEPDHNIPGVALVKQKKRKRKIPLIEKSELDEWAAVMNAEFEEAEKFDLLVE